MRGEEAICFVIRPFAAEFKNIWDFGIRPAVVDAGLDPWDGQEDRLGADQIHRDISRLIWGAALIVADLSGRRPNVMYELGLAHAAKKRVIMLLEETEEPPFDVSHIRYLMYNRNDLAGLRHRLLSRIEIVLRGSEEEVPDFFPELKIVTPTLAAEITYLRERLVPLRVNIMPPSADIFFNDHYVGRGSAEVGVNVNARRNTISASTVGFYEHHAQLSQAEIESGAIELRLEHVFSPEADIRERVTRRLPAWLRDRRRDPFNPVLMRAISSYLLLAGERADALEEIEELLNVAPQWHLSYIQRGFYHGVDGEIAEAIPWYRIADEMCPEHYIAKYNLACNYGLLGQKAEAIRQLLRIVDCESSTNAIRDGHSNLSKDPDFKPLWQDSDFRTAYRAIELQLFPDAPEPEVSVRDGVQGYTF